MSVALSRIPHYLQLISYKIQTRLGSFGSVDRLPDMDLFNLFPIYAHHLHGMLLK